MCSILPVVSFLLFILLFYCHFFLSINALNTCVLGRWSIKNKLSIHKVRRQNLFTYYPPQTHLWNYMIRLLFLHIGLMKFMVNTLFFPLNLLSFLPPWNSQNCFFQSEDSLPNFATFGVFSSCFPNNCNVSPFLDSTCDHAWFYYVHVHIMP